jgi:hypothetical protein
MEVVVLGGWLMVQMAQIYQLVVAMHHETHPHPQKVEIHQ